MELSVYELIILEQLVSAERKKREPKDIITDCRSAGVAMAQHFCLFDCNIDENSYEFKNYWKYLTNKDVSFFFGTNPTQAYQHHKKQNYIDIFHGINKIKRKRKKQEYETGMNTKDDATMTLATLNEICRLYFYEIRNYQLKEITNLPEEYISTLQKLLKPNNRFEQINNSNPNSEEIIYESIIRQRPILYVLVLIDASSSMLWPFLKDEKNASNPNSEDYKQAVKKVQNAIKNAHIKALMALRGSRDCQQRNLKVCQYIFNHEIQLLNAPVTLDKDKMDEIVTLSPENFYPDGMTALYDSIEQSTRLISEKYIMQSKKNMEIDKLILVVITDGEDTYVNNTEKYVMNSDRKWQVQSTYTKYKEQKIKKIKRIFRTLRGHDTIGQKHLESAIIIGLNNKQFPKESLVELQEELGFDKSISINQNDEQALRRAFNLYSSNALNI